MSSKRTKRNAVASSASLVQRPISSFFFKKPRLESHGLQEEEGKTGSLSDEDRKGIVDMHEARMEVHSPELLDEHVLQSGKSSNGNLTGCRGEAISISGGFAVHSEDTCISKCEGMGNEDDGMQPVTERTKQMHRETHRNESCALGRKGPDSVRRALNKNYLQEERHSKFQSKLVGNDSTQVMGRIRTQDAVVRPSDGKMTPLERQVSELQRKHPDCVLAIECGYKFRFFGKDAEIASEVLGIFSFPDRNYLTAAVPAVTIDRHVRRLALAGHKVGVVTQVETAAIKKAGDSRNKLFERRLSNLYTAATLEAGDMVCSTTAASNLNFLRGEQIDATEKKVAKEECEIEECENSRVYDAKSKEVENAFLVCVVEDTDMNSENASAQTIEIAIVALETSTGQVFFSICNDDSMRAELESKLMFASPSDLLIIEPISISTRRLLENYARRRSGARIEKMDGALYRGTGIAKSSVNSFYRDSAEVANLPPLVLEALAHSLDYLKPFGLDSILRQGASFMNFNDVGELALSPNTLSQLEILQNSDDGREYGSLFWLMNRTLTKSGSRLLRKWVSRPLANEEEIQNRLDAVEELLRGIQSEHAVLSEVPKFLKRLPDLERILARTLHKTASPSEFLSLLQSFSNLPSRLNLSTSFEEGSYFETINTNVSSQLLKTLFLTFLDVDCINISREYLNCIDISAAAANKKTELFIDKLRFSDVMKRRSDIDSQLSALDQLRPDLAKQLHVKYINYVSIQNQGDYLVEIPIEIEKHAPRDWEKVSSTKKVVRFRPPKVKKILTALELAVEHLNAAVNLAWKRFLEDFCKHYGEFRRAIQSLAQLDCLLGFASLASDRGYVRPRIVSREKPTQLHIISGRHPVLDLLMEGTFVPNDIHLENCVNSGQNHFSENKDGTEERCAVITGPNMGGKSCFVRQAALLACMAQIGSFVPAKSCTLSVFDGIFTRMGAADNIALGRSTFLEELGEVSKILSHATSRSLVIIDELGRGTSTRDGHAIASATLDYIVHNIKCLCLFVTHYPEVAKLDLGPAKGVYFMGHLLNDAEESSHPQQHLDLKNAPSDSSSYSVPKVTFLYKTQKGLAKASYGINVAGMAGLPHPLLQRAHAIASSISQGTTTPSGVTSSKDQIHQLVWKAIDTIEHQTSGSSVSVDLKDIQRRISNMI